MKFAEALYVFHIKAYEYIELAPSSKSRGKDKNERKLVNIYMVWLKKKKVCFN